VRRPKPAAPAAPPRPAPTAAPAAAGLAWLFGSALFLSATLMFLVEPMVAKMVLPALGGAPAVWNTCMVFYQAALLAGYAYAHAATTRLPVRWQVVLHLAVVVVPLAVLPVAVARGEAPPPTADPVVWLLALLLAAVGPPFFVLATTAPLLQRWFAHTGHPAARDPGRAVPAAAARPLGVAELAVVRRLRPPGRPRHRLRLGRAASAGEGRRGRPRHRRAAGGDDRGGRHRGGG
jgi:hypothetical protein